MKYSSVLSIIFIGPYNEGTIIWKQLKLEGFLVYRWWDRWMEGINQLKCWVDEVSINGCPTSLWFGFTSPMNCATIISTGTGKRAG